ncbi:uncharacterized protein LOC103848525 [Brassica rapa]|uniref:uncharacterized protein LOC103848525 n=1 Tax=Brassica campestris TaxID=3711 RepID=UPI00142E69EC|nr:uncharacterized protein LOC103848525 [Brassica rapa]
MPFGLKNAGSTYLRLVNMMFADQIGETMKVYINDMLVKSLEAEDHISHLQQVFSTLRKYNMKLSQAKCSFGISSKKFLGNIVTHRGIEANLDQIRAIHSIPSPRNVKEVQKLTGRMAALSRFISRLSDKSHAFFETLKKPKDFEWTENQRRPGPGRGDQAATNLLRKQIPPRRGNSLQSSREAGPSSEDRRSETMTLFPSSSDCGRHLVPYKVGSTYDVSGRLAKWAVELGEYDEVRLQKEADKEGEWVLHVDGSSNIRGAGVGIVLTSPTGNTASRAVRCNFKAMNNESEYEALIEGLSLAHQLGAENIQVYSDSQLIINQGLTSKFKSCKLRQIPREQNSQADALANLGSALQTQTQMSMPVLVLQWPATLEPSNEEVSANEEEETWMTPIVWYLKDDILPENRNESRKIKKQAARYCLSQEVLYRTSFTGPYLRCVTPREAARILVELHEEDCGSHSSGRSLVLKAKRAGYYWPTMAEEANKKVLGYGSWAIPPGNIIVDAPLAGIQQRLHNELFSLLNRVSDMATQRDLLIQQVRASSRWELMKELLERRTEHWDPSEEYRQYLFWSVEPTRLADASLRVGPESAAESRVSAGPPF